MKLPRAQAALELAKLGLYVIPLHEPLFNDDNECIGCSCEEWKRENVDPDYKCKTPGKHPRMNNWEEKATTDEKQIRKWFIKQWPDTNIGIAMGKSGLIALDLDEYKENFDGDDFLTLEEQETITNLSGGGGSHLLYLMPEGENFGNSTGELPGGIDIRGDGGQIVAPPSIHPSGNEYQWEEGYSPHDIEARPLPQKIYDILKNAPVKGGEAVEFSDRTLDKPDLNKWKLSSNITGLILNGHSSGDRSSADQSVITALVKAGASNDEILAVFEHYPIGAKYAEAGEQYLARSIGNARAYLEEKGAMPNVSFSALLTQMEALENEAERMVWASQKVLEISFLDEEDQTHIKKALQDADVDSSFISIWKDAVYEIWRKRQSPWEKIITAVTNLGYDFRMNELDDSVEVNGCIMNDGIEAEILMKMYDDGHQQAGLVRQGILAHAHQNRYHPVKNYIESLKWDGGDHIAKLCNHIEDSHPHIIYKNSHHTSVTYAWFRRWFIGAIAKIYDDGTIREQNPMLVLDGGQNLGKSTLVKWIGSPLADLTVESPIQPDDKEHHRYLATKFVWEVVELGSTIRHADLDALKGFITKMDVTFRKPYDRHSITKPALANFIGTINNEAGFLTDPTGNRRFLPVSLSTIQWGYQQNVDIDQVWAQSYALYLQGESWTLSPEERDMHASLTEQYEREDPFEGWVLRCFDVDPTEMKWFLATSEIVEVLQEAGIRGPTRSIQTYLGPTMRRLELMGGREHKSRGPRGYFGIRRKSNL